MKILIEKVISFFEWIEDVVSIMTIDKSEKKDFEEIAKELGI